MSDGGGSGGVPGGHGGQLSCGPIQVLSVVDGGGYVSHGQVGGGVLAHVSIVGVGEGAPRVGGDVAVAARRAEHLILKVRVFVNVVGRRCVRQEQVVAEPCEDRGVEQEDHRRAVHGEQLVELLGADDVVVRGRELRTHHQGHEPAGEEEEKGGVDVPHADPLVIDGREEPHQSRRVLPDRLQLLDCFRRRLYEHLLEAFEVGDEVVQVGG